MINNFISKTTSGLYCKAGDFYIDPRKAVDIALVSHAHGDHAVPANIKVYCTEPTQSFMIHRHGQRSHSEFIKVNFGESFFINEVKITFYPAGHILGSAQILMENEGLRYLYTGDFKTQADESCETFQFIECDHLITETTFASPEYNHPDPVDEIKKLFEENQNVVIGAYALGKAQRLTQLITKYCSGVKVYIHPELEVYHRLYADHGFPLGEWQPYRRTDFENSKRGVYIVPPAHFKRFAGNNNVLKVFATGWKRSFYKCDRVLQVSDHADWHGVLEMITRTKAKKVYTVHGNGSFLKEYLKEQIEVKIIG